MSELDPGLAVRPRWASTGDRRWTLVGNLGQPGELDAPRAAVDPAGLVAPGVEGWALDWWVGAEDRWHLPSQEAAVRQRLVDAAPVVETSMRVPGGDAVHRAYVVRSAGGQSLLVVEIENATPVPFAVALAVRPYGVAGPASVGALALDGTSVTVDGEPAVVLPRPPNRAAAADAAAGDSAAVVLAGDASTDPTFAVRCARGGAQAAFVYPLPHTATIRVLLPLAPSGEAVPRAWPADDPSRQSGAAQVASGWASHASAGTRVELPAGRLADAVAAGLRTLLLGASGDGTGRLAVADRVAVAGALDRWGFTDDAGTLLAALASVGDDPSLVPPSDRYDSDGAALVAVGDHVGLAGDDDPLAALLPNVVHAAGRIHQATGGARWRRGGRRKLLRAGAQPAWLGDGRADRDDLWAVAGLRRAATLLERAGETDLARRARTDADALWQALPAGPTAESAAEPPPDDEVGDEVGDEVAADPRAVADLVLATLGLLPPDHERVGTLVDAVRGASIGLGVRVPATGTTVSPELTAQLASVELARRDPLALDRLDHLLGWASSTWAWPEEVDPETGAAVRGVGHHVPATAAFLRSVRDLLVSEPADGAADADLVLLPVLPATWRGQGIEVHGAPTCRGRLSYAVRWHGERPALLWELEAHAGVTDLRLRAPGLDPAWVGEGVRGEALLAVR